MQFSQVKRTRLLPQQRSDQREAEQSGHALPEPYRRPFIQRQRPAYRRRCIQWSGLEFMRELGHVGAIVAKIEWLLARGDGVDLAEICSGV